MNKITRTLSMLAFALVFMTGTAFAQTNDLDVDQSGNGNAVEAVTQGAAIQDASGGGSNKADIDQVAGINRDGNPTGGHTAFISQVSAPGDMNEITLLQSFGTNALGPSGSHTATLRQNGEGNVIDGTQDSRSNRTADVYQDGNDNSSTFENGNIDVDQLGNENVAWSRGGKTVTQYQEGNNNFARNAGNSAYQYQLGSDNTAVSTSWVSGTATTQEQYGDWNESYFRQLRGGDSNSATSIQDGNYNTVDAAWNQNGSNTLYVEQTSSATAMAADGNLATIDFQSTGNNVNLVQDGLSNRVVSIQK